MPTTPGMGVPSVVGPVGAAEANATTSTPVDFGPNVLVFDANMPMATIQAKLDDIYQDQASNEFGSARYAYFFKPGKYALDVQIGYSTTAHGLGAMPDDVTIVGAVRSKADWNGGNATQNFWRGAENFAVVPTRDSNTLVWAVSQATSLRRVHVRGPMALSDGGYSSGGFIADSRVDTSIDSGSQQQFLVRNTQISRWKGYNWNMVFVGDTQAPAASWPEPPYTVVPATPQIREKPYLIVQADGTYAVVVPPMRTASMGPTWSVGSAPPTAKVVPINRFYIAHAESDTSESINAALDLGLNLILTPGIYKLQGTLQLTHAHSVVLGLGLATLVSANGQPAMSVADVDGITIAGVLFDAGAKNTSTLLAIGGSDSGADHSASPTVLHDVYCRVGGTNAARASSCLVINSHNVIMDNIWLWRADHGAGAGWTSNPSLNGIIVNGDHVSALGLFVEHFQGYQTVWNGNGGRVIFYQSEFPYDPPDQASWSHNGVNGYASYKVADAVTSHSALAMGMYCVFHNAVHVGSAVEAPTGAGISFSHLVTEWLGVDGASAIDHILNKTGGSADASGREAISSY